MIFSNAYTTIKRYGWKWKGVAVVNGKEYQTREKYKRPHDAQSAATTLALQHGAELDCAPSWRKNRELE